MRDARDTGRTRPDTPTIPSRRGLLATGTAALLIGAAIATAALGAPVASPEGAGDDDELIALCAEFGTALAISTAMMGTNSDFFIALNLKNRARGLRLRRAQGWHRVTEINICQFRVASLWVRSPMGAHR